MFPKRWFFRRSKQSEPPFDASAVLFWEFKPAAPGNQAGQLAASAQWQKIRASAQAADGTYLSASQIDAMVLQIAFVQSGEPGESDWHNLRVELRQEGGIYAPAYVRTGPVGSGAGTVELAPGTYERRVRVKVMPHQVYKITPLTVEGPNP